MPLKLRAGSRLVLEIRAQNPTTLAPIPGLPVFLDRLDQPTAAPVQVAGAQTDAQGRAVVTVTLPLAEASLHFRSRSPGIAERYRPDVSPQIAVEVVA